MYVDDGDIKTNEFLVDLYLRLLKKNTIDDMRKEILQAGLAGYSSWFIFVNSQTNRLLYVFSAVFRELTELDNSLSKQSNLKDAQDIIDKIFIENIYRELGRGSKGTYNLPNFPDDKRNWIVSGYIEQEPSRLFTEILYRENLNSKPIYELDPINYINKKNVLDAILNNTETISEIIDNAKSLGSDLVINEGKNSDEKTLNEIKQLTNKQNNLLRLMGWLYESSTGQNAVGLFCCIGKKYDKVINNCVISYDARDKSTTKGIDALDWTLDQKWNCLCVIKCYTELELGIRYPHVYCAYKNTLVTQVFYRKLLHDHINMLSQKEPVLNKMVDVSLGSSFFPSHISLKEYMIRHLVEDISVGDISKERNPQMTELNKLSKAYDILEAIRNKNLDQLKEYCSTQRNDGYFNFETNTSRIIRALEKQKIFDQWKAVVEDSQTNELGSDASQSTNYNE